jgi:GDP-D-mannose 3',5'-epimerase
MVLSLDDICDQFILADLRDSVTLSPAIMRDIQWVFLFAADMGGMGFISNNSFNITQNNTRISLNTIKSCVDNSISRLFIASSACVYPVELQSESTQSVKLAEELAWPANPQDGYGLEKLYSEKLTFYAAESASSLEIRYWFVFI